MSTNSEKSATGTEIIIQQVSEAGEFQVTRSSPFKTSKPVHVPSPYQWPVEGRPDSNLMAELQWYLETFLDYPFHPETGHADRVLDSLKKWGEAAFEALFGNLSGGALFQAATAEQYKLLNLQVASDDAGTLSWPWEALRDPLVGTALAHACRIQRRLNQILDAPSQTNLPQDRVNILLVVARPYGNADVRYRSLARPLVELIAKRNLPAHVDLLRPPTFEQLREHLKARPGFYHILHFDGHGAYSPGSGNPSPHSFRGAEGRIVFETKDGKPDSITATQLNDLLRDYAVPGVVLNACQSAMVKEGATDAFSSVAASLLRSGTQSVVAMAYSLYVSGAQEFLPAFYRCLFETGSMAEAARAGRLQMRAQPQRISSRGPFPLDDWLLPVLYEQRALDLTFAAHASVKKEASRLPPEFHNERNPYGFIGRDSAILELERAMHRPPAGILIHGLGGVGKTTLARGFVRWLEETNGLANAPIWFDFRDIRSAEHVINRMGEPLYGGNFALAPVEKRLSALAEALCENRFVFVWDNFESATGIAGTNVTPNLSEGDRRLLAQLLDGLRGGASKILITSRSEEEWLGSQRRWKLPLGGLDGEERWEYCETVLSDLGKTVDRDDKDYVELLNQLGGHPLAMRVILPELEKQSASAIASALRSNLQSLKLAAGDEAQVQLFAALRFLENGLPETLRGLLAPLSLHEANVDLNYLEAMAKGVSGDWSRKQIEQLAHVLGQAGLLTDMGQATYALHPALTGYLRGQNTDWPANFGSEEWNRAFVDVMGTLANSLSLKDFYEQRVHFSIQSANFHTALAEAERLSMEFEIQALTLSAGQFALSSRIFVEAERLFLRLAKWENLAVGAYYHMGLVAYQQRDFGKAEAWYLKSLASKAGESNELFTEAAYRQLGILARERRDFISAEEKYHKSLTISDKRGNKRGAADTYHELGILADGRRDSKAAKEWYLKSLDVRKKQGDEHQGARTYHQLGILDQQRRDYGTAEVWYRKSLTISKKMNDEHLSASTFAQLGTMAQERGDFAGAENWFRESLRIAEKLNDQHLSAMNYYQLGTLAESRRDFLLAEEWHRKSLAIHEEQGDEHSAAIAFHQLANVAREQGRTIEAGRLNLRAIKQLLKSNDSTSAEVAAANFRLIYNGRSPDEQKQLSDMWSQAGLGAFPPDSNS